METHLLSKELVKMGHKVTVITSRCRNYQEYREEALDSHCELPKNETIEGVRVIRAPIAYKKRHFLMRTLRRVRGGHLLSRLLMRDKISFCDFGPFTPSVIAEIHNLKPDIIMSYTAYYMNTYWAYLAKKKFKTPLVILPSINLEKTLSQSQIKLLRKADKIIAFTKTEQQYLIEKNLDLNKIRLIPNAIDTSEFKERDGAQIRKNLNIESNDPVVLFLGRKDGMKGVDHLIDAMPGVWEQVPSAYIILAGESKHKETREKITRHLEKIPPQKRNQVILIDSIPYDHRRHYFDACNVFITISSVESFGLTYIEAWACGKPVITKRGGIPASYMNEGKDALFAEYGNPEKIGESLVKLLLDPHKSLEMGKTGQERAHSEFSIKRVARQYEKLYKEIIQ